MIRYELIRVDPTRTGGPSWSGLTFVPAFLKCNLPGTYKLNYCNY